MANLQKIVDDLSKLTVLETADLAKRLERKWENERPTSSLSDEELKRARAGLEAGCAPNDFFEKVGALAKKTTPKEWFNEPRLQFLRDAMILGEFAKQLDGAIRVRLTAHADTFPDGFVETSAGTLNIEVTEVDKVERRRGDEYRLGVARPESIDDWEERASRTTVTITSSHGDQNRARRALTRIAAFFSELRKTAEQLTALERWYRILSQALVKYLRGRKLVPPRLLQPAGTASYS
jgi:Ribosomal protein L7/L12 dimerisation domain